jgi:hypothetical protein
MHSMPDDKRAEKPKTKPEHQREQDETPIRRPRAGETEDDDNPLICRGMD